MYTEEQLENLFDYQTINYLRNKNTGGCNNRKGNRYEDMYAVYLIARFSRNIIENGEILYLIAQCPYAFVDDFVLISETDNLIRHFQLKNSLSVSWSSGTKPIESDFQNQHKLNSSINKDSDITLVVSCETIRDNLTTSMPTTIKTYSQVRYFGYKENLSTLLNNDLIFKELIKYLSAFDNPEIDKLDCVAKVLLGAWVSSEESQIAIIDILKSAQAIRPSYIRSFRDNLNLDPEFEKILNQINGFRYKINKGFLHWEFANGLEQGTISHSLETENFQKIQRVIQKINPTTFEDLEELML